jgi:hypothetical protein
VTVPVLLKPPSPDVVRKLRAVTQCGVIPKGPIQVDPFSPAVTVTDVTAFTERVEALKIALVCPAGTTMVVGTVAADGVSLVSVIV